MQFEPKTESELDDEMVMPDGVYDFEVAGANNTVSKKGNEMIALELRVFDRNGTPRLLRDWLLGTGHPLNRKKLLHFCRTTGLDYESGELTAELCVGRAGLVQLSIEDSDDYGRQNRVAGYKVESSTEARQKPAEGVPAAQTQRALKDRNPDDIPF